jgi:hypothetical protein
LASIDRTSYPRFKRVVSGRELVEALTPTPDEITWARGKTQNDQHLLALVVRLKFYQRLGLLPKLDAVPAVVIDHVRAAIGLPEVVEDEEDRDIRPVVRGGISCPVPVEFSHCRTADLGWAIFDGRTSA